LKFNRESVKNKLIFLGTAGARYVAFGLLRQGGGFWINLDGVNIHFDPGPGALIYAHKKGLHPEWLDYIVLSHRHLDHCADINHILEALTLGGKRKKGTLFCPGDAIDYDSVVLKFTRGNLKETVIIKEGSSFQLDGNVEITFPVKHVHGVETYGAILKGSRKIGYIADTKYFEGLENHYMEAKDILIINNTFLKEKPHVPHLCVDDSVKIISAIKPRLAILTHFGMTMVRAKPWEIADQITQDTGIRTVAAWDNMVVDIETVNILRQR
jgi:ribonuclease BN (tRNA processing enzyme)